jgi:hypothetical protein
MNDCQFSNIQIGQRVSYRPDNATCWQCGNVLPPEILDCEYQGHQDLDGANCDLLVLFVPLICPECGNASTFLLALCEGWSYSVSEVVSHPEPCLELHPERVEGFVERFVERLVEGQLPADAVRLE